MYLLPIYICIVHSESWNFRGALYKWVTKMLSEACTWLNGSKTSSHHWWRSQFQRLSRKQSYQDGCWDFSQAEHCSLIAVSSLTLWRFLELFMNWRNIWILHHWKVGSQEQLPAVWSWSESTQGLLPSQSFSPVHSSTHQYYPEQLVQVKDVLAYSRGGGLGGLLKVPSNLNHSWFHGSTWICRLLLAERSK